MTKKMPWNELMSKIGKPGKCRTIKSFVRGLGFVQLSGTFSCYLYETASPSRYMPPGVFQVLRVPRKLWPTTRAGLIQLLEERCTGGRSKGGRRGRTRQG